MTAMLKGDTIGATGLKFLYTPLLDVCKKFAETKDTPTDTGVLSCEEVKERGAKFGDTAALHPEPMATNNEKTSPVKVRDNCTGRVTVTDASK